MTDSNNNDNDNYHYYYDCVVMFAVMPSVVVN